jgi:hypothetical protein
MAERTLPILDYTPLKNKEIDEVNDVATPGRQSSDRSTVQAASLGNIPPYEYALRMGVSPSGTKFFVHSARPERLKLL